MPKTDEIETLYRDLLLDHSKQPRNFHQLPDATATAVGHNRLCGDKLQLYLSIVNEIIRDIAFQGAGCAISTASASMMTDSVKGKSVDEALAIFTTFHQMLTSDAAEETAARARLGKLAVFNGVREFPARVKCATLPWHTLKAALKQSPAPVSTE